VTVQKEGEFPFRGHRHLDGGRKCSRHGRLITTGFPSSLASNLLWLRIMDTRQSFPQSTKDFSDRGLYGYDVSICPTKSAGEF
jgi:hypothetical protein